MVRLLTYSIEYGATLQYSNQIHLSLNIKFIYNYYTQL